MKQKNFFKDFSKQGGFLICLLSLLLFATNALADYSFNLISPNKDLAALGSGPYASVVADVDEDIATITITALGSYKLVGSGIFDLSMAVPYTVNSISYTGYSGSGYVTEDGKNPDPQNIDDQGSFNLVLNAGSAGHKLDSVTLVLIGDWADDYSILAANAKGNLAAAHIWTTSGETGFAGSVPLPGAVWLLGSGLIGIVAIRRRRAA